MKPSSVKTASESEADCLQYMNLSFWPLIALHHQSYNF